jgi:hypothetical protein
MLEKCKTAAARTAMTLYLMLKKANPGLPDYTPENILEFYNMFPLAEGAALLQFISEQPSLPSAEEWIDVHGEPDLGYVMSTFRVMILTTSGT